MTRGFGLLGDLTFVVDASVVKVASSSSPKEI